jgi:hypothetical protein
MPTEPYAELGTFLTEFEAERLAASLASGDTIAQALKEVHVARRSEAKRLIALAGLGHQDVDTSTAVLRAIAGARAVRSAVSPVWTMPGAEATIGRLTSEAQRLIDDARMFSAHCLGTTTSTTLGTSRVTEASMVAVR